MPLRVSHKLTRLIQFPRLVLVELGAIRQAQTRLEEAHARLQAAHARLEENQTRVDESIEKWRLAINSRLDNFFRISLQNQDATGDLIASIKRQIEDLEGVLQELKQKSVESNRIDNSVGSDPHF